MYRISNTSRQRALLLMLLALIFMLTMLCGCGKESEIGAGSSGSWAKTETEEVSKETLSDSSICFGQLDENNCTLSLPAGACSGMADIELHMGPADGAPEMPYAKPFGESLSIEVEPTRLDEPATLVYQYDPDVVDDPLLLCMG